MNLLFVSQMILGIGEASPVLVTRTQGEVTLEKDGSTQAVPKTTFALMDGQTLHIPKGALATVVSAGKAEQIVGPQAFTTASNVGNADVAQQQSALMNTLSRQTTTSPVGATRNNTKFQIESPLPNSAVLQLETIHWSCSSCDIGQLSVMNMNGFKEEWSAQVSASSRVLEYNGPTLKHGDYAIKVDGQYYGFSIPDPVEQQAVLDSLVEANKLSQSLSAIDQLSIEVAILWRHDLWTDALLKIDRALESNANDQALRGLKKAYQDSMP